MLKSSAVSAIALVCFCASAHAASYNFEYEFDGTTLSLVGGSDTPDGTSLADGDSFTLTLSAAVGDYWEVTAALVNAFIPLSFSTSESADRWADIDTTWSLNGSAVDSTSETDVIQRFAHVGAQTWSLADGLMFDQVVIDYTLLLATVQNSGMGGPSESTTIDQGSSDFILQSFNTFFDGGPNNGAIDYVHGMAPVPLPAGMALYGSLLAVGGLMASRRRKRA